MTEIAINLVERLKARWTQRRPRIGELLDKIRGWKDAELSTHMLGWLYSKTDDQIMEESVEMVNALKAVAHSSITKAGEGIMEEVVQLCTLLTTSRADIQTACSRESEDEDDGEQGHHHQEDDGQGHHHQEDDEQGHHHQEDDRDHTLHPCVKTKSRKILCHLLKAPRLTEFASPVSLLTDSDKSGEQSLTGSAQVGKF